MLVIESVVVDR